MVSVMWYPCMFCVSLSIDSFVLCVECLTVFVNSLVKQFVICLGVFVILLLNVECDGVVKCGWRCSIGYTIYGLPKNVCVVPVVPVNV